MTPIRPCLALLSALAFASLPAAQAGTVLAEQKINEMAGGFGGVLDESSRASARQLTDWASGAC